MRDKRVQRSFVALMLGTAWFLYMNREPIAPQAQLRQAYQSLPVAVQSWLEASGFIIRKVYIDGRVHTRQSDIVRLLPPLNQATPIFNLDLEEVGRRVQELPWVQSVRVERRLPYHLYIKISERRPVAQLHQKKGRVLIDQEGQVINVAVPDVHKNLLLVTGVGAQEAVLALRQALAAFPQLHPLVHHARRVSKRRWDLILKNETCVQLPEDMRVYPERLRILEKLIHKDQIYMGNIGVIDLRYADRIYLDLAKAKKQARKAQRQKPV